MGAPRQLPVVRWHGNRAEAAFAAIGGVRPSPVFEMALHDPVLGRTIEHRYRTETLPIDA